MTFKEELVDDFLEIFNSSKDKIANFTGCSHLELLRDTENRNIFFTYSTWESVEALEGYRISALFVVSWEQTKKLFDAKAEAWTTKLDEKG